MSNQLVVEFIETHRKVKYCLDIISFFPLEVAGVLRENTYTLKVNDLLYNFWRYLRRNKDKKELKPIIAIEEAVIKQTSRGESNKNLPWIHTLTVKDGEFIEVLEFFPYECSLLGEENE